MRCNVLIAFSSLQVQLEYPEQDAEAINTSVEGLKKACTLAPQSPLALYTLAATYHRQACLVGTRWLLTKAAIAFETSYSKFPKYVDGLVQYAMVSSYDLSGCCMNVYFL